MRSTCFNELWGQAELLWKTANTFRKEVMSRAGMEFMSIYYFPQNSPKHYMISQVKQGRRKVWKAKSRDYCPSPWGINISSYQAQGDDAPPHLMIIYIHLWWTLLGDSSFPVFGSVWGQETLLPGFNSNLLEQTCRVLTFTLANVTD